MPAHFQHEIEEEESYFVSMTDMMVGLLFIFIIMIMYYALQFRDTTNELTSSQEARAKLLVEVESYLEKQGVRVSIDLETGVLRLPNEVLFPSGSAKLKSEGKIALDILSHALEQATECYTYIPNRMMPVACGNTLHRIDSIYVEGHTDSDPIYGGRFKDNWELSAARAASAYRALAEYNPALSQLLNKWPDEGKPQAVFSIAGYAAERPVASGYSNEAKAQNRRIEIRFNMATPNPARIKKLNTKILESANK